MRTPVRAEWHVAHFILRRVATHYGHTVNELLAEDQRFPLAEQRQIAMYLCRQHTDLSFHDLGALFRRHHTSIIHAIQLTGKSRSKRLKSEVQQVDDMISAVLSVVRESVSA